MIGALGKAMRPTYARIDEVQVVDPEQLACPAPLTASKSTADTR